MGTKEDKKTFAFLALLALGLISVMGYFTLQAHGERVWLAELSQKLGQVPRQPSLQGCLLTGTVSSATHKEVKSPHSESQCVAYVVRVMVRELTADREDTTETELPLAKGQAEKLQFQWQDKAYDLDLERFDLGLWLDEGQPDAQADYPSSPVPSYLPDNTYRGREGVSYQLSEFRLAEGQQVTVLVNVDESGQLVPGQTPALILPGDQAHFSATVSRALAEGQGEEVKVVSMFGLLLALLAIFGLIMASGRKADQWENGMPPLSLRLFLVGAVIAFIATGAYISQ